MTDFSHIFTLQTLLSRTPSIVTLVVEDCSLIKEKREAAKQQWLNCRPVSFPSLQTHKHTYVQQTIDGHPQTSLFAGDDAPDKALCPTCPQSLCALYPYTLLRFKSHHCFPRALGSVSVTNLVPFYHVSKLAAFATITI